METAPNSAAVPDKNVVVIARDDETYFMQRGRCGSAQALKIAPAILGGAAF